MPEGWGTITSSERQTPSPEMTVEEPLPQFAATQEPLRRTCEELEHARQLLGPAPEQLEQEESHVWHVEDVLSKYWDLLQVGRHRPFVRTGRSGGQLLHWLNEAPEQLAQSGWHVRHDPDELNVLEGHVETHLPSEASWFPEQVRQKLDDPAQVPQEESQARGQSETKEWVR